MPFPVQKDPHRDLGSSKKPAPIQPIIPNVSQHTVQIGPEAVFNNSNPEEEGIEKDFGKMRVEEPGLFRDPSTTAKLPLTFPAKIPDRDLFDVDSEDNLSMLRGAQRYAQSSGALASGLVFIVGSGVSLADAHRFRGGWFDRLRNAGLVISINYACRPFPETKQGAPWPKPPEKMVPGHSDVWVCMDPQPLMANFARDLALFYGDEPDYDDATGKADWIVREHKPRHKKEDPWIYKPLLITQRNWFERHDRDDKIAEGLYKIPWLKNWPKVLVDITHEDDTHWLSWPLKDVIPGLSMGQARTFFMENSSMSVAIPFALGIRGVRRIILIGHDFTNVMYHGWYDEPRDMRWFKILAYLLNAIRLHEGQPESMLEFKRKDNVKSFITDVYTRLRKELCNDHFGIALYNDVTSELSADAVPKMDALALSEMSQIGSRKEHGTVRRMAIYWPYLQALHRGDVRGDPRDTTRLMGIPAPPHLNIRAIGKTTIVTRRSKCHPYLDNPAEKARRAREADPDSVLDDPIGHHHSLPGNLLCS